MVKIKNVFGDEYKGKQKHAVYQKRYGKQIRRIKEDKKKNTAPGQKEQQERFRVGLSWYSSLSYVEKEGLKQFLNERGITLTPQQYAIKTALDRGKVSKVVSQEQIIAYDYVEGWHAKGWAYRQEIVITNNNSYDLIDYQVKLDLDSTKVGQNFDWSRNGEDLRFYDENGNKLNYWVEIWDEVNKRAVIWVKVPQIPASGQVKVYMYYGNPAAQSESDGAAVFDFWDDFDTADYTVIRGSAEQVSIINNTYLRIDATSGCSSKNDIIVESGVKSIITGNFIVEGRVLLENPGEWVGWIVETGGSGYATGWYGWAGIKGSLERWGGWRQYLLVQQIPHYVEQAGGVQILRWDRVGDKIRMWDTDGSKVIATVTDGTYNTFSSVAVRVYKGAIWQIDFVRVRKYAAQEPTTTVGAEEYGIVKKPVLGTVENIIVEHSGIRDIYILDENGEEIVRFTDLSNLAEGDIKTIWKWENDTGKTARYVIITSLPGTVNKVRL